MKKTKVLLVDDEQDHLFLLTEMLKREGFDVYPLLNPGDITSVVTSFKPNIIILDVRIGSHDGRVICKQLKAAAESKDIKVILHSAYPELKDEYKLCGADEFLIKPTEFSHLVDRLNFHLK